MDSQLHKGKGSTVFCKRQETNAVNCHISLLFPVFRKINSVGLLGGGGLWS